MFNKVLIVVLVFGFSGCSSQRGQDTFKEKSYSLRKGMSVEEVVRIMGRPTQSSNQPLPSSSEYALGYSYFNGTESLIAIFRERKLMQAKFNILEGNHMNTKDIIQADIKDFSTASNQQFIEQHSSSNSRVRTLNLKDAKNELLDKYLRKEITKEEFFQLRRELEKR